MNGVDLSGLDLSGVARSALVALLVVSAVGLVWMRSQGLSQRCPACRERVRFRLERCPACGAPLR